MRSPGRAPGDPLLRLGTAALALALLFAAAVAAYALLREGHVEAARGKVEAASSEPLNRSDPGIEPLKEPTVVVPETEEPQQEPTERAAEEGERAPLPAEEADWPTPTDEQVEKTREPRRYDLPRGAALGLTIGAIELYDVPVLRSNTQNALDRGVVHARGTSMPWSRTPERNVYLAGHRLGWPGTGSHLVFYRLNELGKGDQVTLKGRDGNTYRYEVTESFVVAPEDAWVMGRVRGRDMLTLQTCTPIPGFQKRLIVRAERV